MNGVCSNWWTGAGFELESHKIKHTKRYNILGMNILDKGGCNDKVNTRMAKTNSAVRLLWSGKVTKATEECNYTSIVELLAQIYGMLTKEICP